MRYQGIPLADRGFVPTGPENPVRWYVEDTVTGRIIGPYRDMAAADTYAEHYNAIERERATTCRSRAI